MSLAKATYFQVSREIAKATETAIRRAGTDGFELFVLWTGQISGETVQVENLHVPEQESYRGPEGLHVRVPGDSLHQLNQWLYEHGQWLVAQVHSHPRNAFHSDTDDAYPMVSSSGCLSIVLADFGRHGIEAPTTALYRMREGGWHRLSPSEKHAVLRIDDGAR